MNAALLILLSGALAAGQAPDKQGSESKPSPAATEKKKGSSLDEDLFGDLTGDLFEGLDRPKLSDPPKQPAGKEKKQPAENKENKAADDALPGQLEGEDLGQEGDPFIELGQKMRRVEQLIAEAKTGQGTQKMQDEIVQDLQKMIELARKQRSSSSSSSSPRKSSKQSDIKTAANKKGDGNAQPSARPKGSDPKAREAKVTKPKTGRAALDSDKQIWGMLPKHLQQAIMNAQSDKVLEEYSQEVQDYFVRLQELFLERQQP